MLITPCNAKPVPAADEPAAAPTFAPGETVAELEAAIDAKTRAVGELSKAKAPKVHPFPPPAGGR